MSGGRPAGPAAGPTARTARQPALQSSAPRLAVTAGRPSAGGPVSGPADPGGREAAVGRRSGGASRSAAPFGVGVTVTVCRDGAGFAALGPQWDALYRRCPSATPFQTHPWLYSWWLSYGRPGRLRLVLVYRADRLIGIAPITLTYRPLPVLAPLGGGISDHLDILLDPGCADTAAAALARGLRRTAGTAVVDLREVRPGGAAERLYAHWRGPRRQVADSVCLELPGVPVDDLLARLPGPRAQRTRAKLRRLDALGIEHRRVPQEEVPAAVTTLLRLHGLQWQGRGVTPEHLRPRFAEHLSRAVTAMVRSGNARLTEYRLDGEVLAADVLLLSAELAGGYLYGAHPALRAKADITAMLVRHDARQAAESGRRVLSMLRGCEPHKQHWRPRSVTNRRLLLARPGLGVALWLRAAAAVWRPRAVGTVRAVRAVCAVRATRRGRPAGPAGPSAGPSAGPRLCGRRRGAVSR